MLTTLIVYCVLIVAASLIGGRLPTLVSLTHQRMQMLISFVGGLMLGIALFHMVPHAVADLGAGQIDHVVLCVMLGLVVMFFLLRTFHFHHHDPEQLPHEPHEHHEHAVPAGSHVHDHPPHTDPLAADTSWMGVFMGLSVHTLIDGLALGASLQAESLHTQGSWMLGLGTFLAILFHKPLDALTITTLMQAAHWPAGWQALVNAAFAAMCPLGAGLFLAGAHWLPEQQTLLVGSMLAFSAGVFLCISLSDLLPEMEFHSHHRIPLSISLLLGIALAWGIRWLEPASIHVRPAAPAVEFQIRRS